MNHILWVIVMMPIQGDSRSHVYVKRSIKESMLSKESRLA